MAVPLSWTSALGQGAVGVTQSISSAYTTASSFTISLSAVASTSSLVILVSAGGASSSVSTVADNAATHYTWSQAAVVSSATSGTFDLEVWIGTGGSGGSVTVTVNVSVSGPNAGILYEMTNLNASPVQSTNNSFNAFNSQSNPTVTMTPTSPGCLVLFAVFSGANYFNNGANPLPGPPWTSIMDTNNNNLGGAYLTNAQSGVGYKTTWVGSALNSFVNIGLVLKSS